MDAKHKRRLISILIIILIVIITSGLFIRKLKIEKEENSEEIKIEKVYTYQVNYTVGQDGAKVNNSEKIRRGQKLKFLTISEVKIYYKNERTTFLAEVTSKSRDISNLKFKLIFLDNNLKVIAEKEILVGDIKINETKKIDTKFKEDVSNSNVIRYEIID